MSDPEVPKLPPILPAKVPIAVFATLVEVTPRRVRQQIAAGIVKAVGRGEVALVPSVRALLADARQSRDGETLAAARAELVRARAWQIDLANARADAELVDIEEVHALFEELAGIVVSGLSGLPAAVTREPALRAKIEAQCDVIRSQMAARFEGGHER